MNDRHSKSKNGKVTNKTKQASKEASKQTDKQIGNCDYLPISLNSLFIIAYCIAVAVW